ncbi:CobD/CbiB family cobalamin biosynthesis protein [Haloplanus halophilus]|uniref:CobD/CbiB family cobalamin biosynthesis protein n=1 Tax=Haloplanus halophilus TaxID=2949993 RepID=UPI002041C718|nr:CobD/CbiB family cobalamin biosynthesis protein [Haloplanus sp. GDY1]
MTLVAAGSVALAAGLDRLVAEPPAALHPVAWLGRALGPLDRPWSRPRLAGLLVAGAVPLLVAALAGGLVVVGDRIDPLVGGVAAGLVCFVATSRRMLLAEARAVVALSGTELPAARERLRSLAGRDAAALDAGDVRSAAVESAAENLADGLVAPLAGFALLAPVSLPLAAAAAAWIKAVNTLDSTFGYRSKPMGWAPARLDDLTMWLPARASAALLAVAAGRPGALRSARPLAHVTDSPNAGWPMATLAVLLGVRLEKPGAYALPGGPAPPTPADADRGVAVVSRAGWLAFGLAGVIALC